MGPLMIGVLKRNDNYLKDSKHGFFFVEIFCHLATKTKKACESNKGILKILDNNSPYFKEKKLEVTKFR
jgi:hypothetical protein